MRYHHARDSLDCAPLSPAREHILALVSGLPSSRRYDRLMVALQGYFDGSTEPKRVLIVAGQIARVRDWLAFADEWDALLKSSDPPMRVFKMVRHRKPAGMERARKFFEIAEKHSLGVIGCAIPYEPLAKVVDELGMSRQFKNPYYLAWRSMVTLWLMFKDGMKELTGHEGKIELIFDEQTEQKIVDRGWDYFRKTIPKDERRFIKGRVKFENDEDVLPLQAADMLAYLAREQYIKDPTRMQDMFPPLWSRYLTPNLMFATLSEDGIRTQLTRDLEAAKASGLLSGSAS